MTSETESGGAVRKDGRTKWALILWVTLVIAFFVWQSAYYLGMIARVAEWQFASIGTYYPGLTVALFIALFGAPIFYLFSRRANPGEAESNNARLQGFRFFRAIAVLAVGSALVAAGLVGFAFLPVNAKREPLAIDATKPVPGPIAPGPATLTGPIRYDRTVTAKTDVLTSSHAIRFAPVIAPGAKAPALTFFVQVNSADVTPVNGSVKGVLRQDSLRGDVAQLFRDAGYNVTSPYYVLYRDEASVRAPWLIAAMQVGVVALVFALGAVFQWFRVRKLSSGRRRGTPHAVG